MGIFTNFGSKIANFQKVGIFKRRKKVQLFKRKFFFSRFLKNLGDLEQFCTVFHFVTPKTRKIRGGTGGDKSVKNAYFAATDTNTS